MGPPKQKIHPFSEQFCLAQYPRSTIYRGVFKISEGCAFFQRGVHLFLYAIDFSHSIQISAGHFFDQAYFYGVAASLGASSAPTIKLYALSPLILR